MTSEKIQTILVVVLLVLTTSVIANENGYGDDYGVEWIYYISDNGTRHVMNFSSIPADTRGCILGDAYFHLYTRQNRDDPEELLIPENDKPMNSTHFNRDNRIKVLTHGWLSSDTTEWLQNIKNRYLAKDDYNVITVDWNEIARNPSYVWPALSTRYVGKKIAKMLKSLGTTYGVQGGDVHLIGHSLGGHVMGYAGMFAEARVLRITGLDPARPLFEIPEMPDRYRLDKSDAEFVDIIHTCGGVLGYKNSHGDADFYPNSGKPAQPGCEGPQERLEGCSHGRSCELYAESILTDVPFKSYPCDSIKNFNNGDCKTNYTFMGDPVSLNCIGDYYLHTKNESKYAKEDDE